MSSELNETAGTFKQSVTAFSNAVNELNKQKMASNPPTPSDVETVHWSVTGWKVYVVAAIFGYGVGSIALDLFTLACKTIAAIAN